MSAVVAPLPFLLTSYVDLMVVIMAPITLLLLSLFWTKNQLGRKEGFLLVFLYATYLTYLVMLEMA